MSDDPSSPLESLLKLAGQRDQPSGQALERAREAARRSWERGLENAAAADRRQVRPRRFIFAAALAAGVASVATVAYWRWEPQLPVVDVARVSAVQGDARGPSGGLTTDSIMRSGDVLSTGEGRVALAVDGALSLRIDRHTQMRFDGAGQVTLLRGAAYVDSGGLNAHTALRIGTPAGWVRHVGTQFQVRVDADRTSVQVREGRVVLTRSRDGALDLAAGDLAEVTGGRVSVTHGQPMFGAAWEWAAATAPSFEIENRPLSEFLAWLAREHGWQLRYADAETQRHSQDIRLHGSLSDLDARGMLQRVSMITGVALSADDGSLRVGIAP